MLQFVGAEVGVGVKVQACSVWCVLDEECERIEDCDELGVIVVRVVNTEDAEHMVVDVCCCDTCEVVFVVRWLAARDEHDLCPGAALCLVHAVSVKVVLPGIERCIMRHGYACRKEE